MFFMYDFPTKTQVQRPRKTVLANAHMILRKYIPSDRKEIINLFYRTVHAINAKNYTESQLNAWAPEEVDLEKWNPSLQENFCLVAIENNVIVGFGDIDNEEFLDRLYVHADHQRKWIATAICDRLEQIVPGCITPHASTTAKPFFEKRGYKVVKEQKVVRHQIVLKNFVMKKDRVRNIKADL